MLASYRLFSFVLLTAFLPALTKAQLHQLSPVRDGSALYFASNHTIPGQSAWPHSKIFRWDAARGVHLYLERPVEAVSPSATNYFELDSPSVSRDGFALAFVGRRICWTCTVERQLSQTNALLRGLLFQWTRPEGFDRWVAEIGVNGQFVVERRASYTFPNSPSSFSTSSLARLGRIPSGRDEPPNTGPVDAGEPPAYVGTRQLATADGTLVRAAEGRGIYFSTTTLRRLIDTDEPVMAPAVNALGTAILYESRFQNGKRRRLYALDIATGRPTLLFTDEKVECVGKANPEQLNPHIFYQSPYSAPTALFGASIDDEGGTALAIVREAADRPRQWLFLIRTDGTDPRWLAFTPEGYREAVISGDGRVIFASTQSGRLLRVSAATGEVEELLGRTPWIGDVTGATVAGAANRIAGGGFSTDTFTASPSPGEALPMELGGVRVEYLGQPMPLYLVSPTEIVYQIPWDFQPPEPTDRDATALYTLRVVAKSESNLELLKVRRYHGYRPQFEVDGIQHENGTPVSLVHPVDLGETLRLRFTGMRLALTKAQLNCRISYDQTPVETISVDLLNRPPGVFEARLRMPTTNVTRSAFALICHDPADLDFNFGVALPLVSTVN